ncbi:MAG TPA: fatty acyl-AMP ligase, partial [Marinobacter sp.]|nr:fatty acyl-AMP ligase [Marinobacter sp.]
MTPNKNHSLPQRLADFKTLSEALDYAADGQTGINFYDGRCRLSVAMPYVILRRLAVATAQRLRALGLQRGDRVALIADTSPGFMEVFYGCQYGGFVPVPR